MFRPSDGNLHEGNANGSTKIPLRGPNASVEGHVAHFSHYHPKTTFELKHTGPNNSELTVHGPEWSRRQIANGITARGTGYSTRYWDDLGHKRLKEHTPKGKETIHEGMFDSKEKKIDNHWAKCANHFARHWDGSSDHSIELHKQYAKEFADKKYSKDDIAKSVHRTSPGSFASTHIVGDKKYWNTIKDHHKFFGELATRAGRHIRAVQDKEKAK